MAQIMTRSGRRTFEEDMRRSQRQAQRHSQNETRPVRRTRGHEESTTLAYKIKHKLRIHLKKYGNQPTRYPSWITSTFPLSEAAGSYVPQIGDDVVFFNHAGYRAYLISSGNHPILSEA